MAKYKRIKSKRSLDLLPSGSTMLNLQLSNRVEGAFPRGKLINPCGDSFAGKTVLLWATMAEKNATRGDYHFYYDEPERDLQLNLVHLFGEDLPPKVKMDGQGDFKNSITIEDFLRQAKKVFKKHDNVLYGLDSFDTLFSEKEKDDDEPGYKAARRVRILNEGLRRLMPVMAAGNSNLFLISQVRENLKAGYGFPKTRSGGRALKHWCNQEFWLSLIKPVTKTIRKKQFDVGGNTLVTVTKNRLTGYKGKVSFPILIDYGIDDIFSQINFMEEFGFWRKTAKGIASPFGVFPKKKLRKYIEDNNLEKKQKKETQKAWDILQKEKRDPKRKRRYA